MEVGNLRKICIGKEVKAVTINLKGFIWMILDKEMPLPAYNSKPPMVYRHSKLNRVPIETVMVLTLCLQMVVQGL